MVRLNLGTYIEIVILSNIHYNIIGINLFSTPVYKDGNEENFTSVLVKNESIKIMY